MMPLESPFRPDDAGTDQGHNGFDNSEFGPLDFGRYGWLKKAIIVVIFSPILLIGSLTSLIRR